MKLLLITLSFFAFANTGAQQRINDRWLTYKDIEHGYQFSYPNFWKFNTYMIENTVSQPIEGGDEINFLALPGSKDTGQKNLDQLAVKIIDNNKKQKDFQMISSTQKKYGAFAGIRIEYINTVGKERLRRHTIIWQISRGSTIYRLMYKGQNSSEATSFKTVEDIFDSFAFLDNPGRLDNIVLKGRWEGTISENVPGTTTPKPYPFTLLIQGYNGLDNSIAGTQLVENFLMSKRDTTKLMLQAFVAGERLSIIYNKTALDKSKCLIELKLYHTLKDGQHYLEGISTNDSTRCYVALALKKVSDETELPNNKPNLIVRESSPSQIPNPEVAPAAQPMPKVKDDAHFEVISKDVTLSSDKVFRWYKWEEAPEYLRNATKYINTYHKETLHDEITKRLKESCPIKIAATDLNDDGIFGICMQAEESAWCCGTKGCDFNLYENGGLLTVDLGTEFEPKPTKNGVISSAGRFFPLKQNTLGSISNTQAIVSRFTFKKVNNTPVQRPVASGKPVGGSTPEELGKTLLRAIKTNDKGLWLACFLPAGAWKAIAFQPEDGREGRYQHILNLYGPQISYLRQKLQEHGFSNFENIRFSRVLFKMENNNGQKDYVLVNESYIKNFYIEFTYGTEFVGRIGTMNLGRDQNGKYFVVSQGGLLESVRRR